VGILLLVCCGSRLLHASWAVQLLHRWCSLVDDFDMVMTDYSKGLMAVKKSYRWKSAVFPV
jgi:hypothetical protein